MKTIGVLGGMGPEASAKFYQNVITLAQQKYGAIQDTDYPPMMIYSLPLNGFDETGFVDKELVKFQLIKGVQNLENSGVDFIVIACNTVHYFIEEMRSAISIPIYSIVEETVNKVKELGLKNVGLLASQSTFELGLYVDHLDKANISYMLPEKSDYDKVTQLILEVMGGNLTENTKNDVKSIIENYESCEMDALILGCTEIPLGINQNDSKVEVFDTLMVLAESALEYAKKIN